MHGRRCLRPFQVPDRAALPLLRPQLRRCRVRPPAIGAVIEAYGKPIPELPFFELGRVALADVLGAIETIIETPLVAGSRVYNIVAPDLHTKDKVADMLRAAIGDDAKTLRPRSLCRPRSGGAAYLRHERPQKGLRFHTHAPGRLRLIRSRERREQMLCTKMIRSRIIK
jgi:nucleoside-diphosphate-sugar epimerase